MLREIAEYPNSFGPLGPSDVRIDTGRYTLCMGAGPTWNTVQRHRFSVGEIDDVIAEVHSVLRERGRTKTQWEVGSSAPAGIVDALLARGIVPDREPYAVALVLEREPPQPPVGLVARRVETFEDYAAAVEVQWQAFDVPADEVEEMRAHLEERWQEDAGIRHAVWLDGKLVSTGTAAPTEHGLLLYGGATAPDARGRGAYRALLRARWDAAVALGTPALITQGGSLSRPILERLGFGRVGEVHMLIDDFADRSTS